MSRIDDVSANRSPDHALNLEQLRKRAKELRKQFLAGNSAAHARVRTALPIAQTLTPTQLRAHRLILAEAQRVIAIEAGFRSWPKLIAHVRSRRLSHADAEAALLVAAVQGNRTTVDALLARHPSLAERSLHCAAALGDLAAASNWLAAKPQSATEPGGPHQSTPLLYLCCSRIGDRVGDRSGDRIDAGSSAHGAQRAELATKLLALGANANDGTVESDTVRGYRTALGGAVDCARSADLARVLLEHGASSVDGPSLYEGSALWAAVRHQDLACLTLLLNAKLAHWQLCHALPHALRFKSLRMVEPLLAHGADPNWTMGAFSFGGNCLHEAVVNGCGVDILERLLTAGAQIEFHDRDTRTPLAVAIRLNNAQAAEWFRRHGADERAVSAVDQWFAACVAQHEQRARQLRGTPNFSADLKRSDHQWLCRLLRQGSSASVRLLLDGGARADVADDDGEYSLHVAAAAGNAELCSLLLDHGASVDARNFNGQTALAAALSAEPAENRAATVAMLLQRGANAEQAYLVRNPRKTNARAVAIAADPDEDGLSKEFERAADAIANGDIDTLRDLLTEQPQLIDARSARAHHATLLHYLGANGVEGERQKTPANAVAIAELLLHAGADPNALCYTYRGGPDQTTLGLLTTSDHPRRAGLTFPLVSTLARHGATLDPVLALLNSLYERGPAGGVDATVAADANAAQRAQSPMPRADSVTQDLALVEATRFGRLDLMQALLEMGADVNAANPQGMTSLHSAAIDGQVDLVDYLLKHGADPMRRDKRFNGTASGWANAGGHTALVERFKALEQ